MRRRPQTRTQRGVALVETALVMTILLLLSFGAAELGFMWRDANRIEHALQSAGRVGSNVADGRLADYQLLRSLDSVLTGLTGGTVERVVVFKASGANGVVPTGCTTLNVTAAPLAAHGVSNTCNVYSPQQVATIATTGFPGTTCGTGSWDVNFCPTGRSRGSGNATYLGIFVRVRYSPVTSFVTGPITMDRTTVYRLEPCVPAIEATC